MRRFFLVFSLLLFFLLEISAQETICYYGSNNRFVESFDQAIMQKQVFTKSAKKYIVKRLFLEGKIWKQESNNCIKIIDETHQKISDKSSGFFSKKIMREFEKINGDSFQFTEYYGGNLLRTGTASRLIPMHLEDTVKEYFPNKQIKSVSFYDNNQLISNENWLSDGSKYIDDIFYSVDETPEYSMGQEYFRNYILKSIQEAKIDLGQYNDIIILGWVIMEDGSIKGVHRVSGRSAGLSNFIIDLIEQMSGVWVPAKLDGEIVRYFMKIPFNFSNSMEGFEHLELSGGMLIWD